MGIAIAGQIPTGLAIAGVKPTGIAIGGEAIWQSGVSWTILRSAQVPTNVIQLDTTGADFIIVGVSGNGTIAISDNMANNWILALTASSNPNFGIFYCVSPITSGVHTITVTSGAVPSIVAVAFEIGKSVTLDQVGTTVATSTTTTILALNPFAPSVPNALVVAGWGANGTALTIDSSFDLVEAVPYGYGANTATAIAILPQKTIATVAPTWTFNNIYSSSAQSGMVSFAPTP